MLGLGPILTVLLLLGGQGTAGPSPVGASPAAQPPAADAVTDLSAGWRVGRGDDPAWAEPAYDDSAWVEANLREAWSTKSHAAFAGFTWYRLRTRVRPDAAAGSMPLGVTFGVIEYAAYEVFVGGQRIGAVGSFPPAARTVAGRPHTFEIPADAVAPDGRLALAVRVWRDPASSGLASDFGTDSRGPYLIGPAAVLRDRVELLRARALLADLPKIVCAVVFALVGLYHLQLYYRRRQLREYLWFGVIAINAASSTFVFSTWTDESLTPGQWSGIGMFALHLNSAAWFEFARLLFGWRASRWLRAYQALQVGLALFSLVAPALRSTAGAVTTATFLPVFVLWLVLIPREALRGNKDARTICFGILLLASARLWQVAASFGLLPRADLGYLGFAGLILAVAVTLANRFSRVYAEIDALNHDLEGKVATRTAELAETVDRLRSSERQAREAREVAEEASQAKSVFLANMSHELRTPLNAILGFVQLLRRNRSLDREARESLDVITRSGEHLLGLINDILSISKIEAGKARLEKQTFDLHALLRGLEETFRLKAQTRRITLEFEIAQDLPRYVSGDAGKVRQILMNLLGNALKFTEAGHIALRARRAEDDRVEFEVEDTGYGIAPDEIVSLFEAFSQTESGRKVKEGTGLGLVISRNMVRLMGGDIRVASELGRGTTFFLTVQLPAATPDFARLDRRVIGLEPGHPPVRVLVADDVPENRHVLAELLKAVGIEVREAPDGRRAVELWREWRPHLIWMDVRMPVMDGVEATRAIRSAEGVGGWGLGVGAASGSTDSVEAPGQETAPTPNPHPPTPTKIVALTASAFEHDRDGIVAAGCDDFVTKPFRESLIFEKLVEHLGVRFVYDGAPYRAARLDGGSGRPSGSTLGLEEMSPEWLAALRHAVTVGDVDTACSVVEAIQAEHQNLATELRDLVRAYRFDEILAAVDAAE